ncbi:MAG TPA: hypothetical protein VFS67_24050 [Polyangiaceae bacterium]|nr:hypothetical protein [Polyangiaceae bacterium]
MRISHFFCFLSISAAAVAMPALARAAEEDPPSIIHYGVNGFWTGAQIGLASGYLATGRDYEAREWRKLVFGAGLGALAGTGLGLTLGIVDAGGPTPGTGWLVLRDTGYGVGLGALAGTATGALFLINSGNPKNLVTGAAIGSLIGAGVGAAVGIIEGASRHEERPPRAREQMTLRFTVTSSPDTAMWMPAIDGTF